MRKAHGQPDAEAIAGALRDLEVPDRWQSLRDVIAARGEVLRQREASYRGEGNEPAAIATFLVRAEVESVLMMMTDLEGLSNG